jgi:uncharacterized protein (DUF1684 family)
MSDLDDFRHDKDEFFKHDMQSPLTREQKKTFTGLHYFPENPALRLEVPVELAETKEMIQMQTSTGDVQPYQKYGRFKFTVEGQEAELTIYAGDYGYFLPFADALAGSETYGAGRYLEPEPTGEGKFRVDFNLAYNPYCAYNPNWSCPLTPLENRLKVSIRAGEKVFPGTIHE